MKKLLFLLLPILSFGQNIQFKVEAYNQDTNEVVSSNNPIEEGQTIRLEVHMIAVGSQDLADLADKKYMLLDFQYPKQMFSANTDCFDFPAIDALGDAGPIVEKYDYDGQDYNRLNTFDIIGNYNHWKNNGGYVSSTEWNTVRFAIQLSNKSFGEIAFDSALVTELPIFDMCLTVKPGAADVTNQEIKINLATLEDATGTQATSVRNNAASYETPVQEAVTYNAKLHFNLPNTLDPTNFKVTINTGTDSSTLGDIEGTYTLDANADVILTDVELDKEYRLFNLEPIDGSYLPDVHTVTDAYRSFKFLTDVGVNGTDQVYNNFELFSADANLNGTFNSGDVYGLLAYVLGLDVNTGLGDDDIYCLPELDESGNWFHPCTAAVLYENYTIDKLGASVDINRDETDPTEEQMNAWSGGFTPTENNLNFDFAFWHHVDLDQSHSTPFPANLTSKSSINLSSKAVATTKLDIVSRIENNKVILELNHNGVDIVGLQARIKFDSSVLELEEIKFDTGNTAANFSKDKTGELLFGSLVKDGNENLKKGKAYQITFNTKQTITNTTGLFYFENTDAVKENGDKVTLNIQ